MAHKVGKNQQKVEKMNFPACIYKSDMQFVTNCTRIKCQSNFLPKKRVNYDNLRFPT